MSVSAAKGGWFDESNIWRRIHISSKDHYFKPCQYLDYILIHFTGRSMKKCMNCMNINGKCSGVTQNF